MKKFLFKLLMACLPFICYIIIFIVFEPYNYFGMKTQAEDWINPLTRVREFVRQPSENIVLGDSRMNHFDVEYVRELTGDRYVDLSSGGQAPNLSMELYEWANTKIDIKKVVLDTSFYQLAGGNRSASAQQVFYIAEHPLDFMVTRDYVAEAWKNMWSLLSGRGSSIVYTSADQPLMENVQDGYRQDLTEYAVNNIYPNCENYSVDRESLNMILSIADEQNRKNGEIKILLPVVHESIWEYVIEPLELYEQMEDYKRELSEHADVYDMEWKSDLALREDYFRDGFHFCSRYIYHIYWDNLFGDSNYCVKAGE